MPCAVVGCTTGTKLGKNDPNCKKHQQFTFPKNKRIANEWLNRINRVNFTPSEYSTVCAKHFPKRMFLPDEVNMDRKGRPRKKLKLTPGAVPILFMRPKDYVNCDIHGNYLPGHEPEPEEVKPPKKPARCKPKPVIINEVAYTQDEIAKTDTITKILEEQDATIKRLKRIQRDLREKSECIRTVLSVDQIKSLQNHMPFWSDETYIKAFDLISLGTLKGYAHLLKLGLPFPSERAVQRMMQEAKLTRNDLRREDS